MAVNLNLVLKDRAERVSVCWDSKSYGLGDPGSKSRRYKRFFFFFQNNPTGSRGHPACHMMGTGDLYWG